MPLTWGAAVAAADHYARLRERTQVIVRDSALRQADRFFVVPRRGYQLPGWMSECATVREDGTASRIVGGQAVGGGISIEELRDMEPEL